MMASATAVALCPACDAALLTTDACGTGTGTCSSGCGSSHGCALLACPGCGRTWPHPKHSRLAFWLARLLTRREQAPRAAVEAAAKAGAGTAALSLATLPPGARARIAELRCAAPERLHQLTALGLVPGMELRLQRRQPTYVVEVDETILALDAQVAGEILLTPPGAQQGT